MMLLNNPKKKIASIIVSKMNRPENADFVQKIGEKYEPDYSDENYSQEEYKSYSIGLEAAIQKLFTAFETKDVKKGVVAMKEFMQLCEAEEEPKEME